uniref:Uncharacterized protein n=1 Tax=Panagrellus redivivus TaxID=6233 RepID=A0A7E4W594_PANRE
MIRFFKAPVATTTTTSEGDHCANEIGPRNPPTSNESNSKGRDRKFNQAMIEVVANDAVVVHSVILQTAIRMKGGFPDQISPLWMTGFKTSKKNCLKGHQNGCLPTSAIHLCLHLRKLNEHVQTMKQLTSLIHQGWSITTEALQTGTWIIATDIHLGRINQSGLMGQQMFNEPEGWV